MIEPPSAFDVGDANALACSAGNLPRIDCVDAVRRRLNLQRQRRLWRMAQPLGNDLLVTIPSGQGEGSIATRVANTHVFTGSDGRNHSSVANGRVAATVANWLFDIERTSGGLQ